MALKAHGAVRGTFPTFSVYTDSLEALPNLLAPGTSRFVLLIIADTQTVDGTGLVDWATDILNRGATYVCCWGPGCQDLETCFDMASIQREGFEPSDRVIMTTSHVDEPLTEAVWFAVHSAFPHDGWAKDTGTTILATVANRAWHAELLTYLDAGAPMSDAV